MNELQRTPEWIAARRGCLTASRVADILPNKNGKYRESRRTLMLRLIAERISGRVKETGISPAMQWGIEHEDEARERYEEETGELVDLAGFILHPDVPNLGASPDGLVGDDGLIEIKCPETETHVSYILDGIPPEKYVPQMLQQLIVTGRKWCDFVSYDPRAKDNELFIVRYTPTEEERSHMLQEEKSFLAETAAAMEQMKARRQQGLVVSIFRYLLDKKQFAEKSFS